MSHAHRSASSSSSHGPVPAYDGRAQPGSSRPSRHNRQSSRSGVPSPTHYVTGALPPLPPVSSAAPLAPGVPMPPQPAHEPHDQYAMRIQYDQIGTLFGGRPSESSSRGHASRSQVQIPPPYDSRTDIESLPTYTKEEEYSAELNRKLFMYGFLFFPLWIVGIIAPFVKPYRDPAKDNRSKEDQESEDANMRKVEMRWAWRCGFALICFVLLVIVAVVVGITVAKHHS